MQEIQSTVKDREGNGGAIVVVEIEEGEVIKLPESRPVISRAYGILVARFPPEMKENQLPFFKDQSGDEWRPCEIFRPKNMHLALDIFPPGFMVKYQKAEPADTVSDDSGWNGEIIFLGEEIEGPPKADEATNLDRATVDQQGDLLCSVTAISLRLKVNDVDGALFCLANIEKTVAQLRNRITGPDQDTPGAKDVFSFLRWLREREMGGSLDAYSIGGLEGLAREFYDETTPVKDLGHVAFLIAAARAAVDRMKMNGRYPEIQACLLEALAAVTGVGDPNADTFEARRERLNLATSASYQHLANERQRLWDDMTLAVWNRIKDQSGNQVEHDNAIHIGQQNCPTSPVGFCAFDAWKDEDMKACLFCSKPDPEECD